MALHNTVHTKQVFKQNMESHKKKQTHRTTCVDQGVMVQSYILPVRMFSH